MIIINIIIARDKRYRDSHEAIGMQNPRVTRYIGVIHKCKFRFTYNKLNFISTIKIIYHKFKSIIHICFIIKYNFVPT